MENRLLVTQGPVKFEESPVEVQYFRKITHHYRRIYKIGLEYIKEISEDNNMSVIGEIFGHNRLRS